jgi:hypothetical protein
MEVENRLRGRKRAVITTPSFLTATIPGNTLYGGTAEIISNGVRSNRTCTIQICKFFYIILKASSYSDVIIIHNKLSYCSFMQQTTLMYL